MASDRASAARFRSRAAGLLRGSRSVCAVSSVRAAWWAMRAARRARHGLATGQQLEDISLPSAPQLRARAGRGVTAVLRRERYTCLERAVVWQAWYAAQDDRRDVVIGVRTPSTGFAAHAWLDGNGPPESEGFAELTRKPWDSDGPSRARTGS